MISLVQLLKEVQSQPKAIIMAGGASVGKSTVLTSLKPLLKDFVNLNADNYVEDKDSPMYGNLSAASSQIRKKDLPNAVKNQQNLIYDTTASNLSTLQPVLNELNDNGYEVMMIMIYAHPIVSFLRNYKRERKVPAVGVLGTWVNVYNLLGEYKRIFGDNFIITTTPSLTDEETQYVEEFNQALVQGNLKQYFKDLLSTGQFQSSFRKDDSNLSPEELSKREKDRAKTKIALEKNIDKIADTYDDIQSNLNIVNIEELPSKVKKFIK